MSTASPGPARATLKFLHPIGPGEGSALRRAPLLRILLPFLAGILVEDALGLAPLGVAAFAALGLALRIVGPRALRTIAEVAALTGLGALGLGLRLTAPVPAVGTDPVQMTLLGAPRARGDDCTLPVWVHGAAPGRARIGAAGDVCASLPGDRLLARLELRAPRPATNPGGADLRRRAARRGTHRYGRVVDGLIEPVGASGRGLHARAERVRRAVGNAVDPRPEPSNGRPAPRAAPLLRALATGDRGRLDEGVRTAFQRSGTAHLLAVSGLHVGWIFGLTQFGVYRLLLLASSVRVLRRARSTALVAGLLAAGAYAALAGLGVPALRAALMASAGVVAVLGGRPAASWNALALAALVALAVDPGGLFEPALGLSFSAVAGILIWRPGEGAASRLVGSTLGAILATAPLVALLGAPLPLGAPLANLVAVPFFASAVVPLALATGALGAVSADLGAALRPIALACAELGIRAVEGMGSPDLLAGRAAPFALSTALALGGLGLRLAWRLGLPTRGWLALALAATGVSAAAVWGIARSASIRSEGVSLLFLDVGHGDAALLRTPTETWLIDAGPRFAGFDAGRHVVLPALRAEGVGRIDVLVITHADRDHVGGAPSVLEGVPVGEVWLTAPALDAPGMEPLRRGAARLGVPLRVVSRGRRVALGEVEVRSLWPPAALGSGGSNATSLTLRIDGPHACAMLAGDLPADVERRVAPDQRSCAVLKLSHHGSRSSTDALWLSRLSPSVAVSSAGRRGDLPHPTVRARLRDAAVSVWETRRHGAVRVRLGARGPVVVPYLVRPLDSPW